MDNLQQHSDLDIRWRQQLDNFNRSLRWLNTAVVRYHTEGGFEDELTQAGLVKFYEMTFEQARKALTYFLNATGNGFSPNEKKDQEKVMQRAVEIGVFDVLHPWIKALEMRNSSAHQYDEPMADDIVEYVVIEGVVLMN